MEDRIGEFILKKKLGEGGMGVVFLAYQESLDREVALKFLTPQIFGGDVNKQRFFREARASAKLVHPNIIQIYSIADYQGNPYYTMEFIDGQDLAKLIREGRPFSVDEAIEVVRAVAKALDLADHHGIVHRDIKPANLMITRTGVLKVMDFGLAKPKETDSKLTLDGQIVGTPTYISPEQALSKPVDVRSDLYSLGCIFYECLAGRPPFQAKEIPQVIFKHVYEAPPPVVSPVGEVPGPVQLICRRLLEKDPGARYQKPADLLKDLALIATNSAAAEVTLAERVVSSKQRRAVPPPRPSNLDVLDEILPALGEVRAPASSNAKTVMRPQGEAEIVPERPNVPPPPPPAARQTRPALPAPSGPAPLTETPAIPQRPVSAMLPRAGSARAIRPDAKHGSPVGLPAVQVPPADAPRAPAPSSSAMMRTIIEEPPFAAANASSALPSVAVPPTPIPARPGSNTTMMQTIIEESPFERPTPPPAVKPSNSAMLRTIIEEPPVPARRPSHHDTPSVPPRAVAPAAQAAPRRVGSQTNLLAAVETPNVSRPSYFVRTAQGLWGYEISKGHCAYSEGLAAEPLPGKDTMIGSLGDCPICANWTREKGCVLAVVEQIARSGRNKGVALLEEQAEAYCSARLFAKAVALLERYIRANVDEPAGYRALARVYDHPEYDGPDRARAVILYKRFVELSREQGDANSMGLGMVLDRINEIETAAAHGWRRTSRVTAIPNTAGQQAFRCFYRSNRDVFFAYCVLTPEQLWVSKVGEIDPITGTPAAEMGNPSRKGSTFFKRLVSTGSVDEQRSKAARELERLQQTAIADLKKDSTQCVIMDIANVRAIYFTEDAAVETPLLKVLIGDTWHELIFAKTARLEGERAALLMRRVTGR